MHHAPPASGLRARFDFGRGSGGISGTGPKSPSPWAVWRCTTGDELASGEPTPSPGFTVLVHQQLQIHVNPVVARSPRPRIAGSCRCSSRASLDGGEESAALHTAVDREPCGDDQSGRQEGSTLAIQRSSSLLSSLAPVGGCLACSLIHPHPAWPSAAVLTLLYYSSPG
jgi:hypothetical protein